MPLISRFSFWSMISSSLSTQDAFPSLACHSSISQSNGLQARRDRRGHACFCSWLSSCFGKICIDLCCLLGRISCFPCFRMGIRQPLCLGTSSSSSSSCYLEELVVDQGQVGLGRFGFVVGIVVHRVR